MHTKGPWTYSSGIIWAGNGEEIPIARMDRNTLLTIPTERDDNARLIAQAPAMVEAIREALALIETFEVAAGVNMLVTKNVLRAPLAKIEARL